MKEERSLIDAIAKSADGIIIVDGEKIIRFANPAAEKLFGRRRNKLVGQPVGFPIAAGETTEIAIVRRARQAITAEMCAVAIEWEGQPACLATLRDVTGRKKAEEKIRESEERFRLLSEAAEEGIAIHDKGVILEANQALARMFGYELSEMIGMYAGRLANPESWKVILEHIAEGYDKPYEGIGIRKDGSTFVCSLVGKPYQYKDRIIRVSTFIDITERKRIEEALRLSDSKLRTLFNTIGVGITVIDVTGRIVDANETALQMTGFRRKTEVIGKSGFDFVADRDRGMAVKSMMDTIGKGSGSPIELTLLRKDGSGFDGEASADVLRDIKGNPVGMICVERDITERKRMEKAVREAAEQWQATFDADSDAICLLDAEQRIMRCNRTMAEMFAVTQKELIGRHCWEIVHGTTEPIPECPIRRVKSSLQREDMDLQRGDRWLHVTADPILDKNHNILGIVHIIRDITERKRIEEEIQLKEHYFRALIERSADGIMVMNGDGTSRYESPGCLRLVGYTEEERVGHSVFELMHPDDIQAGGAALKQILSGSPAQAELRARHKDGSWRTIEATLSNLLDGPAVNGIVVNLRDVTERKRADVAMRESEQKYRLLAENISDVIVLMDMNMKSIYISPSVTRVLGYSVEEALSGSMDSTLTPASIDKAVKQFQRGLSEEKRHPGSVTGQTPLELEMIRKDGAMIWAEMAVSFVRDSNGTPSGILGIIRDITERKKAEEAMRESEKKYSTLVENATDGVTIIQNKVIKFANKRMAEMSGYTVAELTGMLTFDLVPSDFRITLAKRFAQRAQGKDLSDIFYTQLLCKDGTAKEMESSTRLIQYEGKTATLSITRDITERKRMEEALIRISAAVESSSDAIGMSDAQGHHFYHNKAFSELFEYTPEELEAAGGGPAVYANNDIAHEVSDTIMSGKSWSGEIEMLSKSGRKFPVFLRADAIKDTDGKIVGLIGLHTDITERKKALRESEERK